jgi:hypothetical protein
MNWIWTPTALLDCVRALVCFDGTFAGRAKKLFRGVATSGIGTNRTYEDVCCLAAFGGKADASQQLPNNRDL